MRVCKSKLTGLTMTAQLKGAVRNYHKMKAPYGLQRPPASPFPIPVSMAPESGNTNCTIRST